MCREERQCNKVEERQRNKERGIYFRYFDINFHSVNSNRSQCDIDCSFKYTQWFDHRNIWEPASGEAMPGKLQDYLEAEIEEFLKESESELEEVGAVEDDEIGSCRNSARV